MGMFDCDFQTWTKTGFNATIYPLFSLHPGIKKVSELLLRWNWNTSPANWVSGRFEFDWSCHMLKSGAEKAMLSPAAIQRQEGHVTTRHEETWQAFMKRGMPGPARPPALIPQPRDSSWRVFSTPKAKSFGPGLAG